MLRFSCPESIRAPLHYRHISSYSVGMPRRRPGVLLPLELAILDAGSTVQAAEGVVLRVRSGTCAGGSGWIGPAGARHPVQGAQPHVGGRTARSRMGGSRDGRSRGASAPPAVSGDRGRGGRTAGVRAPCHHTEPGDQAGDRVNVESSGQFHRAARGVLRWTMTYTRGMDARIAAGRQDEIASDLHEHAVWAGEAGISPRRLAWSIRLRALRGVPADLVWRSTVLRQADPGVRLGTPGRRGTARGGRDDRRRGCRAGRVRAVPARARAGDRRRTEHPGSVRSARSSSVSLPRAAGADGDGR